MKYGWLFFLVPVVIIVGGLATFTATSVLYAPEKDNSTSQFHDNPVVLSGGTANSTTDVAARMQAILDYHEPIIALLLADQLDAAKRNLTSYNSSVSRLQQKVAGLGASGGDLSIFLMSANDQGEILKELAGQVQVLDTLSAAMDKAGGDPVLLATIASQTEAAQKKKELLVTRYLTDHVAVMKVSGRFGLDTGSYARAGEDLQLSLQVVNATPATVPENLTVPPGEGGRITLLIEPATAVYGDTVQVFGLAVPAQENQTIVLSLDGAPLMMSTTDNTGNYYAAFTIDRIAGGIHNVSATSGTLPAVTREFTVGVGGTTISLTADPGYHNWSETGVYCKGDVAANIPVGNAPVTIFADGQPAINTTTAENGTFSTFVPLQEGPHAMAAQFSADGYPLDPSVSSPVVVAVPSAPIRLADLLGAAALVLLALGAVFVWLVRHPPGVAATEPEHDDGIGSLLTDSVPPAPEDSDELPPEIGTLFARYQAILREEGLSDAARKAYLDLAARIAAHLRLPEYRTLTPRELSGVCTNRSYAGIFDIFVDSYEKIRYGGSMKKQDQTGFEQELKAADTETGRSRP